MAISTQLKPAQIVYQRRQGYDFAMNGYSHHARPIVLDQSFPVPLSVQGSVYCCLSAPQIRPVSVRRALDLLALSQIEAYNNNSDPLTGGEKIDGVNLVAEAAMVIH